jgi:hypothetical protein
LSAARFAPRLADLYMERWTFASQGTDMPAAGRPDNLYDPVANDGGERGRNWKGHTRRSSIYTEAFLHPYAALAVCGALAVGALASLRSARGRASGVSLQGSPASGGLAGRASRAGSRPGL